MCVNLNIDVSRLVPIQLDGAFHSNIAHSTCDVFAIYGTCPQEGVTYFFPRHTYIFKSQELTTDIDFQHWMESWICDYSMDFKFEFVHRVSSSVPRKRYVFQLKYIFSSWSSVCGNQVLLHSLDTTMLMRLMCVKLKGGGGGALA